MTDPTQETRGRPATHPEGNTRSISITVPAPQLDKLAQLAAADKVSRSQLITRAIRDYVASRQRAR